MSASATDPHRLDPALGDGAETHGDRSAASRRVVVGYGFWIFLLGDIVMFAAFFATYAVLYGATASGPSAADIFHMPSVALQTGLLLTSSFACGLATLAAEARRRAAYQLAMLGTGLLGAAFLVLELREFAGLVANGNGPGRSAFLSAYFALVGLHGLHVLAGLLWLGTMMAQVWAKGWRDDILRRVMCFALFWHALGIIWVAVFSTVYLMGLA